MHINTLALVALAAFAGCQRSPSSTPLPSTPQAPAATHADATTTLVDAALSATDATAAVDTSTPADTAFQPPALQAPQALSGPHQRLEALCPSPLQCEITRRPMTTGGVLEIAVLRPRSNSDLSTFALRTTSGWYGEALDPRMADTMIRSHHTPGRTAIDLTLTDVNADGVGIYTVDRGSSFMPGMGSIGSSTHVNVYLSRCAATTTPTHAVSCRQGGMVFQHVCTEGRCTDTGTRPSALTY